MIPLKICGQSSVGPYDIQVKFGPDWRRIEKGSRILPLGAHQAVAGRWWGAFTASAASPTPSPSSMCETSISPESYFVNHQRTVHHIVSVGKVEHS